MNVARELQKVAQLLGGRDRKAVVSIGFLRRIHNSLVDIDKAVSARDFWEAKESIELLATVVKSNPDEAEEIGLDPKRTKLFDQGAEAFNNAYEAVEEAEDFAYKLERIVKRLRSGLPRAAGRI